MRIIPLHGMALRLAILITSAVLAAAPALAQTERRGPFPSRDEWMLAQPLLTLPATSPDPLAPGRYEVRVDGDWGSDFAIVGASGIALSNPSYFVDGEHRSGALTLRRGFGGGLTLGLRASILWRGSGTLDGIIDFWHRTFDLPDGGRSLFPDDRFRVDARDRRGRALSWQGRAGTGLGNLELEANEVLLGRNDASGWRAAAVARLSTPTATGPFADAGSAAGLQLVAARPLGGRTNVYLGVGATVFSRSDVLGLEYERFRPQGFLSLEGRLTRGWSAIVQLDVASRLVTNVEDYPGGSAYLRVGSKFGLRGGWMLEGGITEGVRHQEAITDFGVIAALGRRF
jgi:Protein of unknown function (DUF3187)